MKRLNDGAKKEVVWKGGCTLVKVGYPRNVRRAAMARRIIILTCTAFLLGFLLGILAGMAGARKAANEVKVDVPMDISYRGRDGT